jgi:hypothetical protein
VDLLDPMIRFSWTNDAQRNSRRLAPKTTLYAATLPGRKIMSGTSGISPGQMFKQLTLNAAKERLQDGKKDPVSKLKVTAHDKVGSIALGVDAWADVYEKNGKLLAQEKFNGLPGKLLNLGPAPLFM